MNGHRIDYTWLDASNIIPIWTNGGHEDYGWSFSEILQPVPPWKRCFVEWPLASQFFGGRFKSLETHGFDRMGLEVLRTGGYSRIGVQCNTLDISGATDYDLSLFQPDYESYQQVWPNFRYVITFRVFLFRENPVEIRYTPVRHSICLNQAGYWSPGLDQDGFPTPHDKIFAVVDEGYEPGDEIANAVPKAILEVPLLAFSLANCSNVSILEEEPDKLPRPERRRQEKAGIPSYKYHVLDIKTMTPRHKIESPINQNHDRRHLPLHIVRGHFKEFDEHPLFGKVKGRFWWSACTKGSLEQGISDKDYRIAEGETDD